LSAADPSHAAAAPPPPSKAPARSKPEPVGTPSLPVSMTEVLGHTLLLVLIGLVASALALTQTGLRRTRPPPSIRLPFVLVLSLERPG
jgi:hypothetical protein